MSSIIRMPAIAAGDAQAKIQSWLVSVGDEIAEGQPICEIETEKAVVEYEAEASGVLAAVLVGDGESGDVGQPVAVLAASGQPIEDAISEAGVSAGKASPSATGAPDPDPAANAAATGGPEHAAEEASTGATSNAEPVAEPAAGDRRFSSPLARKLARERGLDLGNLVGSGPDGRIVRRDVEEFVVQPVSAPATVAAAAAPKPVAPGRQGETLEPHTGMRRAIARRLTESKSTVPHYYLVADCRVDELLGLRKQIVAGGTRVSVNDLIVKAVACAFLEVPQANAIWTEEGILRYESVDVSIAVSIPGGLLTPVIRGAEGLGLGALSAAARDYAERGRAGKLKQHELEGGAFSVSNLGMFGTSEFAAVINPPQSGILAVGAAQKRAVVGENDELTVASVMRVTLSADHRVIDGALAAEWLAAFKKYVEHPVLMLV